MLNKVGRKRGFLKVVGFPVAGPLGGARTPVRRNGTGPSRGKARRGHTSPIPAEIGWMRWVYLGRGPLVRPHRRKGFMRSPFSKGPSVRRGGGAGPTNGEPQVGRQESLPMAARQKWPCRCLAAGGMDSRFAGLGAVQGRRRSPPSQRPAGAACAAAAGMITVSDRHEPPLAWALEPPTQGTASGGRAGGASAQRRSS